MTGWAADEQHMALRLGLNTNPADVPSAISTFPGITSCRVFGGFGCGLPSWHSPTMASLHQAGVRPWVSFKDWPDDKTALNMLTAWLSAMPATVPEVWLAYHHEPEGDMSPDLYRARWVQLAKAVRGHATCARVKLTPIHNLYPCRYKLWDRFSPVWSTWPGVWQAWAPTLNGVYLGDYMAWDCYQLSSATRYEDPATFLSVPVGAALQARVPLVLAELGAARVPADTAGTGRAAWISQVLDYAHSADVREVNWWNALGVGGGIDFRLSDTPSADAWRTGIATYHREPQSNAGRD